MYSENAWDKYTKEELENVDALATSYMDFINNGKNERLVVKESIKLLEEKGFKHISEVNELVKGLPTIPETYKPKLKLITKKPILPSTQELAENSRSKSAKLRVAERI